MAERDYVLGTHDAEIERLGLQHLVWRPMAIAAWRRAGITRGSRVLDIGAGPGFASIDFGEIVGPAGEVVAIERSERFANSARQLCAQRGVANVRVVNADLMDEAFPATGFDAAWCRWVACFVADPARLVERIARALKPAGVAIFHEYCDYAAWQVLPQRDSFKAFVAEVMAAWREAGGEPNIALTLPTLLRTGGFDVCDIRPLVFATRPADFIWQWPAAYVRSGADRLAETGRVSKEWAGTVVREFEAAERDQDSVMLTPTVLEVTARVRPLTPSETIS